MCPYSAAGGPLVTNSVVRDRFGVMAPLTDDDLGVLRQARRVLERAREAPPTAHPSLTYELATALWEAARRMETLPERRQRLRTARLVQDPRAQRFTVALTDRACRRPSPARLVTLVERLEERLGIPDALEGWQRFGLRALPRLGAVVPKWAALAVERTVGSEASAYLVSGREELEAILSREGAGELRVNLNHLGEEVVGEEQAARHGRRYEELARRPDVTTLSVKVSSLYSQSSLYAFEESLAVLRERLRPIYRAAAAARPSKLVYLDMEAYRDVELTSTLFMSLLEEAELLGVKAGLVLQAYLPDAVAWQRRLLEFARRRQDLGGAPVRLRLVKGANANLERVESSLRGWPSPVHRAKPEVDAQFKHMLRAACEDEALEVASVGVGSHNLFDIAYALILRERARYPDRVQIEMLYGMAEPLRRAVQGVSGQVLLYVPAVEPEEFSSAVAYLVRRFDENAAEENFLRHGFAMDVGDASFESQRQRFERAFSAYVERPPFRASVRGSEREADGEPRAGGFVNEPDTDPSRPGDRAFLRECLVPRATLDRVPVSLGDGERWDGPTVAGFDPSRPGVVPYVTRTATGEEIEAAVTHGRQGAARWGAVPPEERVLTLRRAAAELRRARQELVRALVLDGGKRLEEADAEVSEAIDFAEYYAITAEELEREYETAPWGLVLVTPPWNFPLAIPLGGVLAALAAGNAVLLKPAGETPLIAYLGAQALWRAGVPRDVLQFVPCHESVGSKLVVDARVDAVILTGATETARLFRRLRPGIRLLAETGGKNAMIVSAVSDRELALRDAVRSAFAHAGQKCSALSLLIVERELHDSPAFLRQLRDAAASLPVGSAWDPRSFVTPLIRPPGGALARALQLEANERWLLEPSRSADNAHLLSPGIKLGVTPGSYVYRTELFGPLLAVLPAEDLSHALRLANGTPYGLTAGFHGLDEREQAQFVEGMRAGNLYVNRTTTGAIVGRQPFGGWKGSSFGPGAKAGGPNYVQQLCKVLRLRAQRTTSSGAGAPPQVGAHRGASNVVSSLAQSLGRLERERFEGRRRSYLEAFERLARAEPLQPDLQGEANWLRYQASDVAVVLGGEVQGLDLASLLLIDGLLGGALRFHVVGPEESPWLRWLSDARAPRTSSIEALAASWRGRGPTRVRLVGCDVEDAWRVLGATDVHIEAEPVADFGGVELLRYLVEQAVCIHHHRYGNLGLAGLSPRPRGLLEQLAATQGGAPVSALGTRN